MATELVFPTYIYTGAFPASGRFNRDLAREIGQLEKMDRHGRAWSRQNYAGGYSSYSSQCNLHQSSPNFAALEKRLHPHIAKFARKLNWDLLGREIRMTTCWANSMGRGTHHTLHLHPLSVLSGVYYVDAPTGASTLKIEDPRMSLLMASPPRRAAAPKNQQNYLKIPAKPGNFVLFESWMRHEVPPHRSPRRRLSVSFNYEWV